MITFVLLGIALCALFYYVAVKPLKYWEEKGVPQTKAVWFFGDNLGRLMRRESLSGLIMRVYNLFPNSRYFGVYMFTQPTLVIRDLELVKRITIKDFDYFTDHRQFISDMTDPIWGKNLFSLRGRRWKEMRPILSPAFTSRKMKTMFFSMSDCVTIFLENFSGKENVIEIDARKTLSHLANDVIISTTFGISLNSIEEPDNEFYLIGKELTDFSTLGKNSKLLGYMAFPKLFEIFNIQLIGERVEQFFVKLVENCIEIRKQKKIVRPDLIHLLMEASKERDANKEEGETVDTGFATAQETYKENISSKELTKVEMAAQAMIFFFGGFDTTTALMFFMAYELALQPDIQERLREEIKQTAIACDNEVTYEALMKMKYLDMVISETLRKWPSGTILERICTKPYTILPQRPGEKPVHVEPGMTVWIPTHGFHHDPDYYPDPERFDPERFSDENKHKIDPMTFIPFGVGPRNCIGSRFALMEAKIFFFHLLQRFEVVPTENTTIPLKVCPKSMIPVPDSTLYLGLRRIGDGVG